MDLPWTGKESLDPTFENNNLKVKLQEVLIYLFKKQQQFLNHQRFLAVTITFYLSVFTFLNSGSKISYENCFKLKPS